jgi:hypothetical protein
MCGYLIIGIIVALLLSAVSGAIAYAILPLFFIVNMIAGFDVVAAINNTTSCPILDVGDLVVTRWTTKGTHRGKYQGHEPTGKKMTVTGIAIERIVNGQIVEGWMEKDNLDQMRQLGLMP